MKFGFVTCVKLGLGCLEEIYGNGGKVELVITLPDDFATKKSGRVWLDDFCSIHGTKLLKTRSVNDQAAINAVREADIDWLFIIGWSQIARSEILKAPHRGVLGMHPTLLPQGRGRAPIPWAIIKGLKKTGVTLFKLEEAVDNGALVDQVEIELADDETATTLYERASIAHRTLLRRVWPQLVDDEIALREQDESQATEWPQRRPEDGRIDLGEPCSAIDRLVRGVTRPYPGSFVDFEGRRFRIWAGRCLPKSVNFDPAVQIRSGTLRFHCADGIFESNDWEEETP